MDKSVSIIVPAFNEERNLESAVSHACQSVEEHTKNYEIIIINDGSSDKTKEIADMLSRNNPRIRSYHNKENLGLGYSYKRGVRLATKEYVFAVAGDDECDPKALSEIMIHIGRADIIIPYIVNKSSRARGRILISNLFVNFMNLAFGLKIKYYSGTVIQKTKIVRRALNKVSNGFAFAPELLVILIKSGFSYVEVPMKIGTRRFGKTSIFKIKNIFLIINAIILLFLKIYLTPKNILVKNGE